MKQIYKVYLKKMGFIHYAMVKTEDLITYIHDISAY